VVNKWPDYAGLRYWAKCRRTGTQVAIYNGEEAGFDTDGGKWSMMCETHGCIVAVDTLKTARAEIGYPDDWCDVEGGCTGEPEWGPDNAQEMLERGPR
jgi:hypothetical protein